MNIETTTVDDILCRLETHPFIYSDEPIGNGVQRLLAASSYDKLHLHFSELLVINRSNQLVGHLSIKDIFCCFFPALFASNTVHEFSGKHQQFTDLSTLLGNSFPKECTRQAAQVVEKHMTLPKKSISPNTYLPHALEIMVKDNRNSLPVIEKNELIGAVRLSDIFRLIGSSYCAL